MVNLYLMGKLPRNASIDEVGMVEEAEEVRQVMISLFGTDDIDEIISRLRSRI
jgi:hypothetical protein